MESVCDIYFEDNYARLYEDIEHGVADKIEVSNEHGTVVSHVIKRQIPELGDGHYFDLVTPYGYGGPIITLLTGNKDLLLGSFQEKMEAYVKENQIVSEFVRFHPVLQNAADFDRIYPVTYLRHTVGTNLKDYDDPITAEFTKKCRKNIRNAIHKGITWRVTKAPEDISEFMKIYYSTMERNEAREYYYFPEKYFENCLKWFKKKLLYVEAIYDGRTIAAGLYFVSGKVIHIHLSGTLTDYLYLSPAYILRYAVALWGKENGFELIHHGGGRSNAEDDSLYLFKKQFAQNTSFDYFIGKKIWNEKIYRELCQIRGADPDGEYFPAYRS